MKMAPKNFVLIACIMALEVQVQSSSELNNIFRDSQNDNKKCEGVNSSHRLFRLNGKDANEKNCEAKCAKNEDCVAFSGIWNQWCIGCDVKLTTQHQGAIAFKKESIQVASACPSSCQCKSGHRSVDENGNCNFWCSKYGYCGEYEAHKEDGVDCRGCTVFTKETSTAETTSNKDEEWCIRCKDGKNGFCLPGFGYENNSYCDSSERCVPYSNYRLPEAYHSEAYDFPLIGRCRDVADITWGQWSHWGPCLHYHSMCDTGMDDGRLVNGTEQRARSCLVESCVGNRTETRYCTKYCDEEKNKESKYAKALGNILNFEVTQKVILRRLAVIEKEIGIENWEKSEYENLLEKLENEDHWIKTGIWKNLEEQLDH